LQDVHLEGGLSAFQHVLMSNTRPTKTVTKHWWGHREWTIKKHAK